MSIVEGLRHRDVWKITGRSTFTVHLWSKVEIRSFIPTVTYLLKSYDLEITLSWKVKNKTKKTFFVWKIYHYLSKYCNNILLSLLKFLSNNILLTLTCPLRTKLRWLFDVSRVKESSFFFKSDLTDLPLRFLMRIFWILPI